MRVIPTEIPEVLVIEPTVHSDSRGFFFESYHSERYSSSGIKGCFVQDNHSRSIRNTVRGLHLQVSHPQAKLIRVLVGEIFDVAVDVRVGSPTFGRWAAFTLSGSNGRQLYIPAGFAHGYQTVSDVSVVMYKCSNFYSPDDERVVRWDDDDLAIPWPIRDAVLSARDAAAWRLRDLLAEWLPSIDS